MKKVLMENTGPNPWGCIFEEHNPDYISAFDYAKSLPAWVGNIKIIADDGAEIYHGNPCQLRHPA